ncbi:hypothetical protein [Sphingosinicella sp. BN140058]|uniref:HD domain-containing protein n=1 Tax=Sphingosinicella sp. BN140058 TaxID=1892855 RepID=UPI00197DD32B|nr:hypothetical protein [Sphingosinicella sp. BN140058]
MTIDPAALERLETQLRLDHDMPPRAYHNFSHVEDCLTKLDDVVDLDPRERSLLRLAILWHDSIYDPTRSDNEERSAARAVAELTKNGAAAKDAQEIGRLIQLTKGHQVAPGDRLGAILVSIDLSILGAEPARYEAYARAIREEYRHVAEPLYRAGRKQVLAHFLAADPLYPHAPLDARYGAQARRNMAAEASALG